MLTFQLTCKLRFFGISHCQLKWFPLLQLSAARYIFPFCRYHIFYLFCLIVSCRTWQLQFFPLKIFLENAKILDKHIEGRFYFSVCFSYFFPFIHYSFRVRVFFPRQAVDVFHEGKLHVFSSLMRDFGSYQSLEIFTDSKLQAKGQRKPFAFPCC